MNTPSALRRTLVCALTASAALAGMAPAMAKDGAWPTKPITLLIPFPAGGGTDLIVRSLQPRLSKILGQPLVIDNKGGAGGTIGSTQLARSRPDGYTAGLVTTSTHAVAPGVYPQLAYDPVQDFAFAGLIGTSPYLLVASPALGVHQVAGLLELLKTKPDGKSYASVGMGTVSHLMGEQFQKQFGTQLTHVPYRGAAPAYTDLIGGQVQLMFDNPIGLVPYVRAQKMVALATTAPTPLLPQLPTFAQQGLPGFEQQLWYGVAFPKNTPAAIVQRMNAALAEVLASPEVVRELAEKGVSTLAESPQAMHQRVQKDIHYWARITRAAGVRVDK